MPTKETRYSENQIKGILFFIVATIRRGIKEDSLSVKTELLASLASSTVQNTLRYFDKTWCQGVLKVSS